MLHAGGRHRMWMGFSRVVDLVATSGQMRVVLVIAAEVRIHTFGAIDVGMMILLVFMIWSEHLMLMLTVFLAYKAVIQDGGLVRGCKGVSMLQNCPLASLHMWYWCSEISTAIILSCVIPRYLVFMS